MIKKIEKNPYSTLLNNLLDKIIFLNIFKCTFWLNKVAKRLKRRKFLCLKKPFSLVITSVTRWWRRDSGVWCRRQVPILFCGKMFAQCKKPLARAALNKCLIWVWILMLQPSINCTSPAHFLKDLAQFTAPKT